MLRRILLSIVSLLIVIYLAIAVTGFNRKPSGQTCHDMELVVKDTANAGFITKKEVKELLEKKVSILSDSQCRGYMLRLWSANCLNIL